MPAHSCYAPWRSRFVFSSCRSCGSDYCSGRPCFQHVGIYRVARREGRTSWSRSATPSDTGGVEKKRRGPTRPHYARQEKEMVWASTPAKRKRRPHGCVLQARANARTGSRPLFRFSACVSGHAAPCSTTRRGHSVEIGRPPLLPEGLPKRLPRDGRKYREAIGGGTKRQREKAAWFDCKDVRPCFVATVSARPLILREPMTGPAGPLGIRPLGGCRPASELLACHAFWPVATLLAHPTSRRDQVRYSRSPENKPGAISRQR